MPISDLSTQLEDALDRFAWEEWAQMGIFATAGPSRQWAQDPEALLLFTFEVARGDARLFDEVLDWLLTNEQIVNLRRLRSLAVDPEDQALTEAVIAWLDGSDRRPGSRNPDPLTRRRLCGRSSFKTTFPSPTPIRRSRSMAGYDPCSQEPESQCRRSSTRLSNLSFRLRLLFGLTARGELARLLFTMEAPGLTSATLARAAGFTKRNVHEALSAFELAGVVSPFEPDMSCGTAPIISAGRNSSAYASRSSTSTGYRSC